MAEDLDAEEVEEAMEAAMEAGGSGEAVRDITWALLNR